MRPEFGCGIHDYVFAPNDSMTQGMIAHEVAVALDRWEPRIEVADVLVHVDEADQARLYIDITYNVRGTNDPRNLVFPFYTLGE
jgi:phage baseplate assembly protein W